MDSFVDGISNLIGFYLVLGSMLGLYMAPLIIAMVRDHHRLPWIGPFELCRRLDRRRLDCRPGVVSDGPARSDHADRQHRT